MQYNHGVELTRIGLSKCRGVDCSLAMPEALEVFGVPLSQPVRAVVWACMIKRLPFELKMIVPGFTKSPYGSRSPEYLGKTRLP